MSDDRLTMDGLQKAVERIEAHWPGKSKWENVAAIWPTLNGYDDGLLAAAVSRLIHAGETWQPGPVDVLNAMKDLLRERARERQQYGSDHPNGHVLSLVPDVLDDSPDGMREAYCVIPGCGFVKKASAGRLATEAERHRMVE